MLSSYFEDTPSSAPAVPSPQQTATSLLRVRELRKDNAFLAGEQAEQLKRQRKIRDERWVRPIRRRGVFVRAG